MCVRRDDACGVAAYIEGNRQMQPARQMAVWYWVIINCCEEGQKAATSQQSHNYRLIQTNHRHPNHSIFQTRRPITSSQPQCHVQYTRPWPAFTAQPTKLSKFHVTQRSGHNSELVTTAINNEPKHNQRVSERVDF